jgi:hypothetical protein
MKEYQITLNEEDIRAINSTFNAREMRVKEWLRTAKAEGKDKEVARWEAVLEEKNAVVKKINSQLDMAGE